MPLIGVLCQSCGHESSVSEALLGREVVCPRCKASFTAARASTPDPSAWRQVSAVEGPAMPSPFTVRPTGPESFPIRPIARPASVAPAPATPPNGPGPSLFDGLPPLPTAATSTRSTKSSELPTWAFGAIGGAVFMAVVMYFAMLQRRDHDADDLVEPAVVRPAPVAVRSDADEYVPPSSVFGPPVETPATPVVVPTPRPALAPASQAAPSASPPSSAVLLPAPTASATPGAPANVGSLSPRAVAALESILFGDGAAALPEDVKFFATVREAHLAPGDARPMAWLLTRDGEQAGVDFKNRTLAHESIRKLVPFFAWVDVDAARNPRIVDQFHVHSFPSLVVVDRGENKLDHIGAPSDPERLAALLKRVLHDYHYPHRASSGAAASSVASGPPASSAPAAPAKPAMDLADLVQVVEPSVVRIEVDEAIGSGFVVDEYGTVVTNYHVMEGATKGRVKFANGQAADIYGFYLALPERDLCVIRISYPDAPLKPLPLAKAAPRKGEKVAAFGSPKGLSFSASEGIVSAVRTSRQLKEEIGDLPHADDLTWIQTTTPISGGNSGGPLVNERGEVVGVNTMSLVAENAQNLNFAVSCLDVSLALAAIQGKKFASLAELPKPAPGARRPSSGGGIGLPPPFTLPSGKLVDAPAVFGLDLDWTIEKYDEQIRNGGRVLQVEYPSGKTYGLIATRGDLLDGPVLAFYENGRPMTFAGYSAGKRHGNLIVWDEGAKPLLMAQYDEGKKYGLALLLEDQRVRLIEEYDGNALKAVHLFTKGKIEFTYTPPTPGKPAAPKPGGGATPDASAAPARPENAELAALMDKLAEVEKRALENEKKLVRWVRKNARNPNAARSIGVSVDSE